MDAQFGVAPGSDVGGNMSAPDYVVYPRTVAEACAAVRSAKQSGQAIAMRGRGLSQSGISVHGSSGLMDARLLNCISADPRGSIIVGAGASYHQVLTFCAATGAYPAGVPICPYLTVGGVMAVGGISADSFKYGLCAKNATRFDCIDEEGVVLHLDAEPGYQRLAESCGKTGFIAAVRLPVRRYPGRLQKQVTKHVRVSDFASYVRECRKDPEVHFLDCFYDPWIRNQGEIVSESYASHDASSGGIHLPEFYYRYTANFRRILDSIQERVALPWFEVLLCETELEAALAAIVNRLPAWYAERIRLSPICRDQELHFSIALWPTKAVTEHVDQLVRTYADMEEELRRFGAMRYAASRPYNRMVPLPVYVSAQAPISCAQVQEEFRAHVTAYASDQS